MKKVLAICLMLVILPIMTMNVFAVPGGFLKSPSVNPAPNIVEFQPPIGCNGNLIITPYSDRDKLHSFSNQLMERAYSEIKNCDDLTKLNSDFAKLVSDKNIDVNRLAVSDLFDISVEDCTYDHNNHRGFKIILDADTLKSFVALLHMDQNGEWKLVKNAKVTNDGNYLEFDVDTLTPFAVIVETPAKDSPQTGDSSMIHIYFILMVVSALTLVVLAIKSRKSKNNY